MTVQAFLFSLQTSAPKTTPLKLSQWKPYQGIFTDTPWPWLQSQSRERLHIFLFSFDYMHVKCETLLHLHWRFTFINACPRTGSRTEMETDPKWTTESGAARGLWQKYRKKEEKKKTFGTGCTSTQWIWCANDFGIDRSFFHFWLYFHSFICHFIM